MDEEKKIARRNRDSECGRQSLSVEKAKEKKKKKGATSSKGLKLWENEMSGPHAGRGKAKHQRTEEDLPQTESGCK